MTREEAERRLTELTKAAGEMPSGLLCVGSPLSAEEFLDDLFILAEAGRCYPSEEDHDHAILSYVSKYLEIELSKAETYLLELDRLMLSGNLPQDNIQVFVDVTNDFRAKNRD